MLTVSQRLSLRLIVSLWPSQMVSLAASLNLTLCFALGATCFVPQNKTAPVAAAATSFVAVNDLSPHAQ